MFGQGNENKVAVLMALDGDSYVKTKNGENKLELPYFFTHKDLIDVKTGKVELLKSSGEEIVLVAGESYKIEEDKELELININEFYTNLSQEKYFNQSQSNSALTVRGQKMDIVLFPISSKLADKEHAFIICDLKTTENIEIELDVINMQNDELIFSKKNIESTEIALKNIPLQQGNEYVWTMKIDGKETDQIGLITYLDNKKQEDLVRFELTDKADYIRAYQYYVGNEFWFAAKRTIQLGTEAYPETDLFIYLLEMMVN